MTAREAALKVYCLWSWIEQQSLSTHDYVMKSGYPLFYELNLDTLYATCPWCEVFNKTRDTDGCSPEGSPDCPLVKVGQGCDELCQDGERTWWKIYQRATTRTSRSVAAGNIAALAWKEYKRFGG